MYIDSIESFIEAGQQLFINSPGQVWFLWSFLFHFPQHSQHILNKIQPTQPGASSPRIFCLFPPVFAVSSCGASSILVQAHLVQASSPDAHGEIAEERGGWVVGLTAP